MLGIGDAGAHIKSISNYGYPTYVLGELAARRNWLSIPDAVRRLTTQPAEAFGLKDRGVLRAGAWADVCVIDLANLRYEPAEMVADIPGGSSRLHRSARGYSRVLVNGHEVVRDDKCVSGGTKVGQLLRV
jgi:N-acyl-D-aspartate/D-glutamate deacylase